MSKYINLIGKRFGRLIVLKYSHNTKFGESLWLCKCDCGNETVVNSNSLRRGTTKSCGCFQIGIATKIKTKHGLRNTRLYGIWSGIKDRCYNKNDQNYKNYGGRKITVCDEWKNNFMSFYNWAMNNRYITYKGETKTLTKWAENIGINHSTLIERIARHGIEKSLSYPKLSNIGRIQ